MQTEIILAKYGELALKGLNRNTFEDILMKNIKRRLKPTWKIYLYPCTIYDLH